MILESILESEYALLLEFDTKVRTYYEQPKTFSLVDEEGKTHRYTPDFLLVLESGKHTYIEVKPTSRLMSGRNSKLFELFKKEAQKIGSEFEVVTENLIQKEPLLSNLKFFYRYRKNNYLDIGAFEELASKVSMPIVFQDLTPHSDIKKLYEFIAHGLVQFDIKNEIFSPNSEVWFNEK